MDAYLSRGALQDLKALSLLSSSSNSDGILIGHIRGHRYFVEKAFPSQRGFIASAKNYFDLDQLFDGKLIGFYSFQPDQKNTKKILVPFAYGKLFLQVRSSFREGITIKSFVIDFDGKFYFSPIRLNNQKK